VAKASVIKTSFNAGELSPQLKGRTDIEKYANGCATLENFLPQIHGSIKKRPGTRFVNEVKTSANNCRLIPFEYSTEQAYVLEFGDQYIRFYKDGGNIESGGSPYEIVSPYLHTELTDIHFAQSADVMYIAHPNHPPQKLARTAHDSWTITEVDFDWPPFNDENTTAVTITASAVTGVGITLTASAASFASTDVGNYVKFREVVASKYNLWTAGSTVSSVGARRVYDGNLYESTNTGTTGSRPPIHTEGTESDGVVNWTYLHDGAGYAEITAFSTDTSVTATVVKTLPTSATSGTEKWSWGAWSDTYGYPKTVVFHEDRLWFAGSSSKPQTLWASTSGDYENHKYGTEDDDALNYTINSQEVNTIEWLVPGKSLFVGTSGSEFVVAASNEDQAITPTNVRITPQSSFGSKEGIQPFRVGSAVIFVQRAGRKLREFAYVFSDDAYKSPNLTILAEHITSGGIADMAYQQEPDQIIWIPDGDGQLLGLTYERAEDVVGWHRCPIAGPGEVESVTTIPHWDGDQNVVWMVVKRTIDGSTVRYIEYMEKYLEDDYALFLDSALTYDGAAATNISGLDHLEGETVSVLADGYIHPDVVVSSGAITLQAAASVVNIGLSYNATMVTMPLNAGAQDGTSQGKTSRITNTVVRLHETGPGLWYGPDTSTMDEYHTRDSGDLMDNPVPLFTGDTDVLPWPDGYETPVQVALQHRTPLPCTIIALMPQVHVYDR